MIHHHMLRTINMPHPDDIPFAHATLRDYYAAHAPEAPAWFQLAALDERKLPFALTQDQAIDEAMRQIAPATPTTALLDVHRRLLRNWLSDGCYELEGVEGSNDTIGLVDVLLLAAIGKRARELGNASVRERERAAEAWERDTWFAWRFHYAAEMVKRSAES